MLHVSQLTKKLPDGRTLLHDISFTVKRGEFVGVLGASGAGKSLTLRCILGLTRADGGEVTLQSTETDRFDLVAARGDRLRDARRRMGVIFQGFNLVKRLRVLDNVMIGRLGQISPWRSWFYGFTDAEAVEAMAALQRVKMEACAERITGTLSGGEMQRVAIARAIFQRPAIYLADEPIASLDPSNSLAIMKLLQPLARETPVLGVFHQPDMTARFCTRVIGIKHGRIIYDGSPLLSHAQLEEIYGNELAEVVQRPATPAVEPVPELAPAALEFAKVG
jgi:phosphonate transport system ATP-binding protein